MMESILFVFDLLVFIPFAVWILYFLLFAIGYRVATTKKITPSAVDNRYLVVFPAYKENAVIVDSVTNFLQQTYAAENYNVVVVADELSDETLDNLRSLPVQVLIPDYTKRSKAAALKMALAHNILTDYEGIVILDADNHVDIDFLTRINAVFEGGNRAIQAHRVAKNQKTDTAYLDGLSEEINNSIFRQGHNNLGLPAALSGSGMVFDIAWFSATIAKIDAVGEDKELEYYLLKDKVYTLYLEDVYVYDEKVNKRKDMSNQRKRWIAAQLDIFLKVFKELREIVRTRDWPMLDKLIQWSMPPRIMLLGGAPLWIIVLLCIEPALICKWGGIYMVFLIALLIALPNRYYIKRTGLVLFKLPSIFIAILRSLVGLKSARTTFIHTPHGEDGEEDNNH